MEKRKRVKRNNMFVETNKCSGCGKPFTAFYPKYSNYGEGILYCPKCYFKKDKKDLTLKK